METLEKYRVGVGVEGEEFTDGYICGWVTIPRMALRDVRSVKARDCGSYVSRPPCFKSSCDICWEY